MAFVAQGDTGDLPVSPGGFAFGVQGWTYGEPRPTSITFFLDGSAMVCDQYGRPIKGAVTDGKQLYFALGPPEADIDTSKPYQHRHREEMQGGKRVKREVLATHAQVIAALEAERIDYAKLTVAGVPQLPYEQLKALGCRITNDVDSIRRIPDPALRRDMLRVKEEAKKAEAKEAVEAAA